MIKHKIKILMNYNNINNLLKILILKIQSILIKKITLKFLHVKIKQMKNNIK